MFQFQFFIKYKILIIISTIITISILLFTFLPQLWMPMYFKVKYPQYKYSYLYIVPEHREIIAPLFKNYQQLFYYGIQFSVPGNDKIIDEKEVGLENDPKMRKITFSSDKSIILSEFKEADIEEILEYVEQKNQYHLPKVEVYRKLREEFHLKSNFEFRDFIYNQSPNQFQIWMPQSEAIKKFISIIQKLTLLGLYANTGELYKFAINQIKGFQIGNHGAGKPILIKLYYKNDVGREIFLYNFNQEEIDFILSTIQIK